MTYIGLYTKNQETVKHLGHIMVTAEPGPDQIMITHSRIQLIFMKLTWVPHVQGKKTSALELAF